MLSEVIQVYTGDGKGKTTAALGLALRAMGHAKKTIVIQFLKDDPQYGEFIAQSALNGVDIIQTGRNDFVNFKNPEQIDIDFANQGWEKSKKLIMGDEYDIVVLDEFTFLLQYELINVKDVYSFLKEHSKNKEIVITGRYATQELVDIDDLVTEMKNVKHYFDCVYQIREGIDN